MPKAFYSLLCNPVLPYTISVCFLNRFKNVQLLRTDYSHMEIQHRLDVAWNKEKSIENSIPVTAMVVCNVKTTFYIYRLQFSENN